MLGDANFSLLSPPSFSKGVFLQEKKRKKKKEDGERGDEAGMKLI